LFRFRSASLAVDEALDGAKKLAAEEISKKGSTSADGC